MKTQTVLQGDANFRYIRLADELEGKIGNGEYGAGEKLPSIRKLHDHTGLSVSTIYQAYIELEKRGAVEPREKSGFYVRPFPQRRLPSPRLKRYTAVPKRVTISGLVAAILEAMSVPSILNLGGSVPEAELLPHKQLSRIVKAVPHRELSAFLLHYDRPEGMIRLRQQILKRTLGLSRKVAIEDVITTNGCLEAVSLCLRAVAGPGDTILVESPTFHGFLQLIEDLNMYALEVPTDPETGIDPEALKRSLARNRVRACLLVPNFQNPIGALIPADHKEELVGFLNLKNIPVIEDDIYGDLYFGRTRPPTLKSFDRKGLVLYCSSFSKTLSPGLRVGWTLPGRFGDRVKRLKLNTSLASAKLNQFVIAEFLKTGAYDRHLRRLRNALRNQMSSMALAVARHFPDGTEVTAPGGGIALWVQLNKSVDGLELFHRAIKKDISILPGAVCSTTNKYSNCIRLSCGHPWNERVEKGIITLARMIDRLSGKK